MLEGGGEGVVTMSAGCGQNDGFSRGKELSGFLRFPANRAPLRSVGKKQRARRGEQRKETCTEEICRGGDIGYGSSSPEKKGTFCRRRGRPLSLRVGRGKNLMGEMASLIRAVFKGVTLPPLAREEMAAGTLSSLSSCEKLGKGISSFLIMDHYEERS